MDDNYYFDPCDIDDERGVAVVGDELDDGVTLDNWKPTSQAPRVPKSKWRELQNDGNYDQQPGLSDLKKIQMFLKKGYPDHQIMDSFAISCDTLLAIKNGNYCPIEGIRASNLSKITREFGKIDRKIDKLFGALNLIADNTLGSDNSMHRLALKNFISPKRGRKAKVEDSPLSSQSMFSRT